MNVGYGNISSKFDFQGPKVKVFVAIFRKTLPSPCHLHLLMDYENILSKFDFQCPGLRVKVTVAIFRKTFSSLVCLHLLMDFNITTQMLDMIISRASSGFRVLDPSSYS